MGRAGRWMVAALVAVAAFAVATWVSGALLFTRSPDIRWPVAFGIGAAAAAFAGLWGQWWATESGSAARAAGPGLAEIADGLAARLRSQWEREAAARGLTDAYPLSVAWTAADAPLAGDLDALRTVATGGFGWAALAQESWASGPEDLAGGGGGKKLADVLATVPTGRLVVLGEPGTGKTMLMVGLVLDLLARRDSGGPVPVLAPLASWDPAGKDLHGWLGATLMTDYPDLAAAPPPGSAGGNRFEALLGAGLILPILDGLDELTESARPVAITRINKELKSGEQVVLTCRTEQYRAAVIPENGPGAFLRAAAVQLSTLEFGQVATYLRKDAGPAAEGRWKFMDTLSPESPVRQALTTPLMAGLARAIYNPRPGEHAGKLPDPAELCDFADRAKLEAHLLDAFIPAAYRPSAGGRWTARQAETWLTFLARHLDATIRNPDLAWWRLRQAASGNAFMAAIVIDKTRRESLPARGMRISARGLRIALVAGLVAGLLVGIGIVSGTGPNTGPGSAVAGGLVMGLGVGLGVGFVFGLTAVPGDLAGVTSPAAVLARDRRLAILLMLAVELTVLGLWLAIGFDVGFGAGPKAWEGTVFMVMVGLVMALALSMMRTEWPPYLLTRGWLAFRHDLPWSLMSFLADAHRRGVLRQAGAVYQFRHIDLQHRLAASRL